MSVEDPVDTFRDVELVLTAKEAVIGYRLAPQRHCDNANLEPVNKINHKGPTVLEKNDIFFT